MLSYLLAALESEEDKRRFTELYEENHVRAEQMALRILRDPHDAEDAVQNAFLQVIHHFDEISEIPCKKLGFWIISIVKNEALMILRRKQKELPQEDWDTFSADVSDPTSYNELVRLTCRKMNGALFLVRMCSLFTSIYQMLKELLTYPISSFSMAIDKTK